MYRKRILAAVAALVMAGQGFAQTTAAAGKAKAHEDADLGSVYVRCDGSPPHRSAGEIAARVLLIMATSGLAGPGEQKDISKRLKGAEAVKACDEAITKETDPIRKVQLTLARAIHHIETKEFEAALTDARSAPSLAGPEGEELGFKHSLLLSSYDIEAAALVWMNRPAEAEAVGLKLAELAPYDLLAQQRAARYVDLTADMTPAKKAFFDRFARIAPRGLIHYADAAEWAGDYAGSAAAFQAFADVVNGFSNEQDPAPPMAAIQARVAIALAMAGDKRADAVAAEVRAAVDELVKSGKALNMQALISEAEELLDFEAVISELNEGNAAQARMMFAGRSRWMAPSQAAVSDLAARLRKGAKPVELVGTLGRDPAEIRASGLAAKLGAITGAENAEKLLYSAIRPAMTIDDYKYWNDDIRDVKDSDYIVKRRPKDVYTGEFVYMRRPNGIATGDALLMHCALLAKYRGVPGFVFYPSRQRLEAVFVRFGKPGEPGMPDMAFIDAQTVIAAFAQEFPEKYPPRRR